MAWCTLILTLPIGVIAIVLFLTMHHMSKKPFFGPDDE